MKKTVAQILLILFLFSPLLLQQGVHAEWFRKKPEVVKIGLIAPFSGNKKWIGDKILKGVQLAMGAQLEELEVDVRLSIEDSQGDPALAASALRKLGNDRQVLAVIGPAFSESVEEVAPIASDLRIPAISPTAVAPYITNLSPYLFRNSITGEEEVKQLVDYAMRKMGIFTFSVLYPLNTVGKKMQDDFLQRVEENGGEILYSLSYHSEDTDFGEILTSMGGHSDEDKPKEKTEEEGKFEKIYAEFDDTTPLEFQAIFIPGDPADVSLIIRALDYYNLGDLKLLGTSRWNSKKLLKWGGSYLEGAVFVDGFFAGSEWTHVADFVNGFKNTFGEEPDIISAQSFDTASILLKFIQTGINKREAVEEALLNLVEYPGVSGFTTFLANGDAEKELFILTVKNGKVMQLY